MSSCQLHLTSKLMAVTLDLSLYACLWHVSFICEIHCDSCGVKNTPEADQIMNENRNTKEVKLLFFTFSYQI